jgi:hypothetical protein
VRPLLIIGAHRAGFSSAPAPIRTAAEKRKWPLNSARIKRFFKLKKVRNMEVSCEKVRENLKDYSEHRLEPPLKGQIERHIFACSDCILQYVLESSRDKEEQAVAAGS